MNNIESSKGEIVMYQPDETIRLEVRMDEETVWLTQQQMAELFQKDQSVVARHINNAFKEGELDENSNMHFLHNTRYKYRPTVGKGSSQYARSLFLPFHDTINPSYTYSVANHHPCRNNSDKNLGFFLE